jgi:hypothetical protein
MDEADFIAIAVGRYNNHTFILDSRTERVEDGKQI